MIKLTPIEMENYRKFTKPHSVRNRKVDQIVVKYPENSRRHELGKINIAFMILDEGHHFIMEAQERLSGGKVRDVVDITDMIVYEVETDSHRGNRHKEIYIQVIRVDYKGNVLKCRKCKNFARYIKYDKGFCKSHYKPTSSEEQSQKWNGGLDRGLDNAVVGS